MKSAWLRTFYVAFQSFSKSEKLTYMKRATLLIFISVLDLVGIALLAMVAIQIEPTGSNSSSNFSDQFLRKLPLPAEGRMPNILLLSLIAFFFFLAKSLVSMVVIRKNIAFLSGVAIRDSIKVSNQFFSSNINLVRKISSQDAGITLSSGANSVYVDVLATGMIMLAEIFLLLSILISLSFINIWTSIGALAYFLGSILLTQRIVGKKSRAAGKIKYESSISQISIIQDCIESFKELYVLGGIRHQIEKLQNDKKTSRKGIIDWQWAGVLPKYFTETLIVLAILLVMFYELVIRRSQSFELIGVLLITGLRVLPSILRIQQSITSINGSHSAVGRYLELRELAAEHVYDQSANNMARIVPSLKVIDESNLSLEIRNVSFSYNPNSSEVLKNVNLSIGQGRVIAIAGPSGSGKSTLLDLVLGLQKPTIGRITIGLHETRHLVASWPGYFAYVPQKPRLLNASLLENISIGVTNTKAKDIESRALEVLEMVGMMDLISTLENGIHEICGEHGTQLSGGQLQRISIARALFHRPKIIILDEATSALDANTESAILDVLLGLKQSCTIIMAAHREKVMKVCDEIILLSRGEVIATGNYDLLLETSKDFLSLLQIDEEL